MILSNYSRSRSRSRYDPGSLSIVLFDQAVAGLEASLAYSVIPDSIIVDLQHANKRLR